MFNKFSITTGVVLLSSVILSAEQAQAIVYSFENFNPGGGPISATGTLTVVDSSNDGIVDFPSELTDWEITLTNSINSDSSILTKANSLLNGVIDGVDATTPFLTGVTVTPTLVDFTTADNIVPGVFNIESRDSLLNDQLLITTATDITNPLSPVQTTTETLILTDELPLASEIFSEDVPLEADAQSTATLGGPPTFQATADSASVPFEFSPSLGLITIGFTWGFSRFRKMQLSKK